MAFHCHLTRKDEEALRPPRFGWVTIQKQEKLAWLKSERRAVFRQSAEAISIRRRVWELSENTFVQWTEVCSREGHWPAGFNDLSRHMENSVQSNP